MSGLAAGFRGNSLDGSINRITVSEVKEASTMSKETIGVITVMIIFVWGILAWSIYNDRMPSRTVGRHSLHTGLNLKKALRPGLLATSYHTQADPIDQVRP